MEFVVDLMSSVLPNLVESQGAQNGLIALFIWFLKRHFASIEKSVQSLADNLLEVKSALLKVEQTHLARFKSLEDNFVDLGNRVEKLEGKNGDSR